MSTFDGESSYSSDVVGQDYSKDTTIRQSLKRQLKEKIFLGRYLEKRLVHESIGYRDLVLISAADEELIKQLESIKAKLTTVYPNHWIGITDPQVLNLPKGLCLWVQLSDPLLGASWFQIKTVKFRSNEIFLELKCIRYISDKHIELEPLLTGHRIQSNIDTEIKFGLDDIPLATKRKLIEFIIFMKRCMTISNVQELFTFMFAIIIAVTTGSFQLVHHLGNFILALMRESSLLVNSLTPFCLGCLDVFTKIVGGFYLLIAMIFRPERQVQIPALKRGYPGTSRQPQYGQWD